MLAREKRRLSRDSVSLILVRVANHQSLVTFVPYSSAWEPTLSGYASGVECTLTAGQAAVEHLRRAGTGGSSGRSYPGPLPLR